MPPRSPRTTRSRSAARAKPRRSGSAPGPKRAHVVWMSFLGSMTLVGGLLLALEKRPSPRLDGRTLAPLLAASAPGGYESLTRTRAPLNAANWQAIVIHHSGAAAGSPESIAAEHEARNGKGLGHHFVIGNGAGMSDGEIVVGFRWLDQHPGFHAAGPNGDWYNRHSISICLVGDGNRRAFTPAQLKTLAGMLTTLSRELGIPRERIFLHSDIAPASDPGRFFPASYLDAAMAEG